MPSGGARARSGPPPDPNALRRDRKGDASWLELPARCELPAPPFPLTEPTDRELVLWEQLWARPQASAWHQLHQGEMVAMYVRRFCEAELPGAPVSVGTLVRQLADSLGLSVPGLNSLRWRIVADQVEEAGPARSASVTDLRARLAAT